MIKKLFTCFMVSLLSAGMLASTALAKDEVINWKMQFTYDLADSATLPMRYWAQEMEKLTNGRLKIQFFPPGALAPTAEVINFLEKGVFDAAMCYGAYYTGAVPETAITTNIPMGPKTTDEAWEVWHKRGLQEILRPAFAARNIMYYMTPVDPTYVYMTKTPINKLDDLKGKKIRAVGMVGKFTQLLGAAVVNVPGPEIYMALKLGTADGALYSATGYKDRKLNEAAPYRAYPSLNIILTDLYINMDSLKKLPPDIRSILDKNTEQLLYKGGLLNAKDDEAAQVWADQNGSKRTYLSDADIKKATKLAQTLWDDIAKKNERCAKAIAIMKQFSKEKGRLD